MNQDPTGNKPLSSSKPPVYIPPVQRPGQAPPMYHPPSEPLHEQLAQDGKTSLEKKSIGLGQSTNRPGRRIKKSGGSSGLPTGRPNSRNCSSGGKKELRRCRDRWLCLPFRASKTRIPPPGYYQPLPRKQRADYQYLAKRSFTSKGSMAVLFSVLFSALFTELVLWGNIGLSVLILTVSYCAFSFWYFRDSNAHFLLGHC